MKTDLRGNNINVEHAKDSVQPEMDDLLEIAWGSFLPSPTLLENSATPSPSIGGSVQIQGKEDAGMKH